MPAYNFQARFAPLVESGAKTQTIRETDRGAKPGGAAYLYTGQRTPACRKLGEGTITAVTPIEITRHACGEPVVILNAREWIVHGDLEKFAVADGFGSVDEFMEFFQGHYGLPFRGFLHEWVIKP